MSTATKGKLQTKFGEVGYTACGGADYVYIGGDEPVTVFGVAYNAHCRLKRVNGLWEPEGSGAVYLSRRDTYGDGSPAARKAVREAYTAAWTEFVTENPEVLTEAAREQLEREIERLEADMVDTYKKYDQLRAEQMTKTGELEKLVEQISTARFTKVKT